MQRRIIIQKNILKYEEYYLKDFKIEQNQIIQKERLVALAEKYSLKHIDYNHFFQQKHFCSERYFFHLGDKPFDRKVLLKLNSNFTEIYTVNCEINDPRIFSIPLGVTDTSHCDLIGDLNIITEFNNTEKKYINLAYINFNTERKDKGLKDRLTIKKLFSQKKWVTDDNFNRTKQGHRNFIKNIYNHKFVFCPRGNGVDTHRLWMSLYLKTIPIVIKEKTNIQFRHLPIVFIDNWNQINEQFLLNKYEEMNNKKYDFSILRLNYWEKKFANNNYISIPYFVIHYTKNTDRKERLIKEFEKYNISDVRWMNENDRENMQLNEHLYQPNNTKKINKGEISLTLKHYFALKEIVEKEIPLAVIMEDNVTFIENIKEKVNMYLNEANKRKLKWDIIFEGDTHYLKYKEDTINKNILLYKKSNQITEQCLGSTRCSNFYIINLNSAKEYYNAFVPFNNVCDHWSNHLFRKLNFNIWWVEPPIVHRIMNHKRIAETGSQ